MLEHLTKNTDMGLEERDREGSYRPLNYPQQGYISLDQVKFYYIQKTIGQNFINTGRG